MSVSPAAGTRVVLVIRSVFKEPIIVIEGIAIGTRLDAYILCISKKDGQKVSNLRPLPSHRAERQPPVATSGASKVHLSRSPDIKTFTMAGSHTEIGTNDHEIEE